MTEETWDENEMAEGEKQLKLWQIPKGSSIKVTLNSGREVMVTFYHLDGMYSYCSLNDGDADIIFHLSRFTPLRKVDDYYEIIYPTNDQETNN